jgi:uncharacterized protein (TIGR02270 family)
MQTGTDTPQARPSFEVPILWDIMEEYVDETEFALERFESALDDREYNLQEVADGPEEKIDACIDGLVIGGPQVVERLLIPGLDEAAGEPPRATALVLALLAANRRNVVHDCFAHSSETLRAAAARACALDVSPTLDPWLRDQLRDASTPEQRATLLEVIAARGIQLDSVSSYLASGDSAEVAAAAKAARHADARTHLGAIQALTQQGDAAVRDAAIITALHYGSLQCWNLCERLAVDPAAPHPLAMQLYAALGGPQQHDRLIETLALDSHRGAAIRALGFSGSVGVVDRLLTCISEGGDELDAKLAAEAIASIAGLDLRDDQFLIEEARDETEDEALPPLEEDLDTDLTLDLADALPVPNPEAIAKWWEETRPKLNPTLRHLAAQPWSPAAIGSFLESASLRSRHPVALSLSIRTGGQAYVDTRAFAKRQHAQMQPIASLGRTSFVRSYSQW